MDIGALNRALPIVPHDLAGTDCCGCIVARDKQDSIELVCSECNAIVGTIHPQVFVRLVKLEAARPVCPYCDQVNVFPGYTRMLLYIYQHCGRSVKVRDEPIQ
jgi:uncharacterized Zn-finger protein